MKKVICLLLGLALAASAFVGCSQNEQNEPTELTEPTELNEQQEQLEQQEQQEQQEVNNVMELTGMHMTAENVSPYEGIFLEDPALGTVSGVYAMKFTNTGDQTIHSTQLIFSNGVDDLVFWVEMMPAGQSVIVAEMNAKKVEAGEIQFVDGTMDYLEAGLENPDAVEVTCGSNDMMEVRNVTQEALPLVRVFYRSVNGDGILMGGPCYSVVIDGLDVDGTVEVEAEYWDENSAVVSVLVVNE